MNAALFDGRLRYPMIASQIRAISDERATLSGDAMILLHQYVNAHRDV